ncbi:type II toxin-antitoxin system VapC family toxin [Azospirillum lipoferum]|uniref:type II toxin-antitoxin system VapC family toxin n=1 Tax=Azospirillum lipoferum TaxID=193 RepID=UPI001872FCEC|nr:type II toxin-antitoxin system VapC family toxin [Azospirillum lipoferum]
MLSVPSTTILPVSRGITAEPRNFHQYGLKLSVAFRGSALDARLAEQGGLVAGFDPAVCLTAGMMDWPHRDPFDSLLAATAMHYKLPLVSAGAAFDGIVTRLW